MVNSTSAKPIVSLGRVCHLLFHYGVYDLPLPCRFHMSPLSSVKNNLASIQDSKEIYQQIEFLSVERMAANRSFPIGSYATTVMPQDAAEVDFSNLYPAVIECFAIILCGYIAGRGNLISQTEAKGLNVFVGTFSLPALIFVSLAKLDFNSVNWIFLSSICISKTIVFCLVVFVTLLVYRPMNFGKAGLFAIFCTQSNDFALGYPIVAALYGKDHPEFASYLYLVAPISLVFLNPLGFILMEIEKHRTPAGSAPPSSKESRCGMCLSIVKEFLMNPFVFMTVLGIVGNFVFHHKLPNILEGILKVLGQAFSASALFLLGLSMVGKVQNLRGSSLVAPGILIAVKTLLLPLVTRETVSILKPGVNANETADFSNYGFLYGTFPTAPGLFVFASKYDIAVDMIASAMVACTFLSAPLMFISAKMVTLVSVNPLDYVTELEAFLYHVSIIGLICSVWVTLVFCFTRKWRKVPHFITLCLAISQCIACIGALMWSMIDHNHTWKLYLQFFFFSFGVFATRFWTAILAVSLFLLRWRSLCFVLRLRPYLALFGWGVPAVLVSVLVLMVQEQAETADKHDPNFQYGATQAIVALLLLWLSLFTTMVCLILHQRFEKRYAHYEHLISPEDNHMNQGSPNAGSPEGSPSSLRSLLINKAVSSGRLSSFDSNDSLENVNFANLPNPEADASEIEIGSLFSYRDRPPTTTSSATCDRRLPQLESGGARQSSNQLTEPEEMVILRDRDDEYQMMRHVVLLLLLCGSMIVGFALCMWTLVTPEVNGIYVELVFLDVVLNFGQGVFTAIIFGMDIKLIVVPLMKGWRRLVYGAPTIKLPAEDKLDPVTRQTCDQFSTYHMDKCIRDIVRDRRWRLKHLPSVFAGNELVDWLLLVGLAHDRTDAIKYGRRLLQGRVIRHTEDLYHFHDQPIFYTFGQREDHQQYQEGS